MTGVRERHTHISTEEDGSKVRWFPLPESLEACTRRRREYLGGIFMQSSFHFRTKPNCKHCTTYEAPLVEGRSVPLVGITEERYLSFFALFPPTPPRHSHLHTPPSIVRNNNKSGCKKGNEGRNRMKAAGKS